MPQPLKSALPLEPKTQEEIKALIGGAIAPAVDDLVPNGYGFIVVIAPCSAGEGYMNWTTSMNPADADLLRHFLRVIEARQPGNIPVNPNN